MSGDWADDLPAEEPDQGLDSDERGQQGFTAADNPFDRDAGAPDAHPNGADDPNDDAFLGPFHTEGSDSADESLFDMSDRGHLQDLFGSGPPGEVFEGADYPEFTNDNTSEDFAEAADFALPSLSSEGWAHAIGSGGVDPAGAHPTVFGHLDLDDLGTDGVEGAEPDWLRASEADSDRWAQPDLLEDVLETPKSALGGGIAGHDSGAASIESLWWRLTQGQAMPTTSSGAVDLSAALDALAVRAGDTPLREVVNAARRLLSG